MRRKLILLFLLGIILMGLYWFYSHSIIRISVDKSSNVSFMVASQNGNFSKIKSTTKGSVRFVVPKGNYEIKLTQQNNNFFAVESTGAFLKTTQINADLTKERSRTFVGDDPLPCMLYTNTLYSFKCDEAYSDIKNHVPASDTLPTYISTVGSNAIEGQVTGQVSSSMGTLLLVHNQDVEGGAGYTLYSVDEQLKPIKSVGLSMLSNAKSYSICKFNKGFLIYSSDFKSIYSFISFESPPQEWILEKPSVDNLSPVAIDTNGNYFSIVYSHTLNDSSRTKSFTKSELITYGSGKPQHLLIGEPIVRKGFICGQTSACVITDQKMIIYNIITGKKTGQINGAVDIVPLNNNVLVIRSDGAIDFNVSSKRGYLPYSFSSYRYCGSYESINASQYILCMSTSKDKNVALFIDSSKEDEDNIDKKIQQLEKSPLVSALSIYERFIYITPALGPLEYNKAINGYTYNQAVSKKVNGDLSEKIDTLGINKDKYTIINNSQ